MTITEDHKVSSSTMRDTKSSKTHISKREDYKMLRTSHKMERRGPIFTGHPLPAFILIINQYCVCVVQRHMAINLRVIEDLNSFVQASLTPLSAPIAKKLSLFHSLSLSLFLSVFLSFPLSCRQISHQSTKIHLVF